MLVIISFTFTEKVFFSNEHSVFVFPATDLFFSLDWRSYLKLFFAKPNFNSFVGEG